MLDASLHTAHSFAPEFGGGLSNHAPMVMEVMEALGQEARIPRWLEHYKGQLEPFPTTDSQPASPILGRRDHFPSWLDHWRREIEQAGHESTLRAALPSLLPGISASAGHGLLRVAHATRGLERHQTPERAEELAHGLAYWSATFARLPGVAGATGDQTPLGALGTLKLVPSESRSKEGLIQPRLQVLEHAANFKDSLNEVQAEDPEFLDQLTELFARIFLNHHGSHGVVFLHAFTGPSALRLLKAYLSQEDSVRALKYAWQFAAAVYATHGDDASLLAVATEDLEAPKANELIESAMETGAAHAIKMTEACLREWEIKPKPVFLFAARHAIQTIAF